MNKIRNRAQDIRDDNRFKSQFYLEAALSYLHSAIYNSRIGEEDWPYDPFLYKQLDYVGSLRESAAFILAEIERCSES